MAEKGVHKHPFTKIFWTGFLSPPDMCQPYIDFKRADANAILQVGGTGYVLGYKNSPATEKILTVE